MATATQPVRTSAPRPATRRYVDSLRWLSWIAIPSWLLSLALHMVLIVAAAYTVYKPVGFGSPEGSTEFNGIIGQWGGSAGLLGDGTGQPTGEGVGIHLGPGEDDAKDKAGDGPGTADGASKAAATARPATASGQEADETPPVDLELPTVPQIARLGSGQGSFSNATGDAREMIRSNGRTSSEGSGDGTGGITGGGDGGPRGGGGTGGHGGGGGGSGRGGTSFFGHKASGTKFVYVLDASGSMYDYNAISVAKAELLSSLQQLEATEQFQIIFYNEKCRPLRSVDGKDQLLWGTDTNRTIASQFIREVQPDGGTRHLEAMLMALSYGPDVIFFLTDAGEPVLYPGDLDKIKKRNNGRSRIFSIEFGKGSNLKTDNFLKKLARENGGAHAYRDVQEFRKK
jgi:hypothetical protein